ncbi:MAG: TetR/AcrR family transcriptional regulator [Pseudomonadota bacterium]
MTLLHRNDPDRPALIGNIKVTREDWLTQARDVLISHGIDQVKILPLAERMGVSRSSFYWYFKDRAALLDALLDAWAEENSAGILAMAAAPSATITAAVCNIFRCVIDPSLFNMPADFAVRAWGRSDATVAARVAATDARRLTALTAMFTRHHYPAAEAETRAYVLYYMQIGYDLAVQDEPIALRVARIPEYLFVFTGQHGRAEEIHDITALTQKFWTEDAT